MDEKEEGESRKNWNNMKYPRINDTYIRRKKFSSVLREYFPLVGNFPEIYHKRHIARVSRIFLHEYIQSYKSQLVHGIVAKTHHSSTV